jgi:hypothetical protein
MILEGEFNGYVAPFAYFLELVNMSQEMVGWQR